MNQARSGPQHIEPPRFALARNNHALGTWLIQLLGVTFIPFIYEILEGTGLGWSEVAGSPFGMNGIQVLNPILISVLAFAAGYVVSTKFSAKGAKWIWTLPCAVLLLAIIWDLLVFHNWHLIWIEYFYWDHPGADEGAIGRDLLTYPVLSAVAYSVAAAFVSRPRSRPAGPANAVS